MSAPIASTVKKKIVVCGGNGFLGAQLETLNPPPEAILTKSRKQNMSGSVCAGLGGHFTKV